MLIKLNKLTSPAEVFAGASLIIPQSDTPAAAEDEVLLAPGQSVFEAAIVHQQNPWTVIALNELSSSWDAFPGYPVGFPGKEGTFSTSPIPLIKTLKLKNCPYTG